MKKIGQITFLILFVFLGVIGLYKLHLLNVESLEYVIKNWQDSWKQPLLEAGVAEDEIDDCMRWAFGKDYLNMQLRNVQDFWNQRHEDIFIMYGSDDSYETFKRIGEAYKKLN